MLMRNLKTDNTTRGYGESRGFPDQEDEETPHFADGGIVPDENFDYSEGHASEYDSSGEPGTEDYQEDEQPMSFMARGGRVKKMASGGKMPSPHFIV